MFRFSIRALLLAIGCTVIAPLTTVMASDSLSKSAKAALFKIEQLMQRQRELERKYLFREAAKVHAEAVEVAKKAPLSKQYIRDEEATHRTYELLAGMTKDQQTEYLGAEKYIVAAKELDKKGNHHGAFEVHSKGLDIYKRLFPDNDIARFSAQVDMMHLRAKIEQSDNVLRDLANLKSQCRTLIGADDKMFALLLNAEIIIRERRGDWSEMTKLCEELDKTFRIIGEDPQFIAGNYQRMALSQLKDGKLDSAWESTRKAISSLEPYEGLDRKQLEFWIFITGGRILMAKMDFLQAETYFRKARLAASVYQEGVFPEDFMPYFRDAYAECLVKLGKQDEADKLKAEGAFP